MDLYSRGHYLNNKFQSHQYFTGCYWLALTTKKSSGLLSQMQKCMLRTSKFSCTNSVVEVLWITQKKGFARVTQTNGPETGMDTTNHKTSPLTLQPFLLSCSLNISQFFLFVYLFVFSRNISTGANKQYVYCLCKSQDHRMDELGWVLWRSSSTTLEII